MQRLTVKICQKLLSVFLTLKLNQQYQRIKKSLDRNIKLSDGGGLYLLLDKKNGVYWRFDYVRPITKKRATIAIGVYPACSLAKARSKRNEFREQLTQNLDPQF